MKSNDKELMSDILKNRELLLKVLNDYLPKEEDDDDMLKWKKALSSLPIAERIIFIIYSEFGSYRSLAKLFNVSHPLMIKEVKSIRAKLLKANGY